jgi:hypothetical protein
VADLITTCFGGRNRKCAEAFVRSGSDWEVLERDMLGGQKLQGTLTAGEVYAVLQRTRSLHRYPLFNIIYRIMQRELPPAALVQLYHHVPKEEHHHHSHGHHSHGQQHGGETAAAGGQGGAAAAAAAATVQTPGSTRSDGGGGSSSSGSSSSSSSPGAKPNA